MRNYHLRVRVYVSPPQLSGITKTSMAFSRPTRSGSSSSWGTFSAYATSAGSVFTNETPSPRNSPHLCASVTSAKRSRCPEPDSGESVKRARVEDTRARKKPSKRARGQKARVPKKATKRSSTSRKKIAKTTPTRRRSSSKRAPPKKTASTSLSRRAQPSNSPEPVTFAAESDKSESSFSSAHDHDSDYAPGRRRKRTRRDREKRNKARRDSNKIDCDFLLATVLRKEVYDETTTTEDDMWGYEDGIIEDSDGDMREPLTPISDFESVFSMTLRELYLQAAWRRVHASPRARRFLFAPKCVLAQRLEALYPDRSNQESPEEDGERKRSPPKRMKKE